MRAMLPLKSPTVGLSWAIVKRSGAPAARDAPAGDDADGDVDVVLADVSSPVAMGRLGRV
jgi:hypothetical protein